jgi:UDP-glucose 4-epimerase
MNKNIAIIGGSGFIGCNFSNFFAKKGYRVLVIGRNIEYSKYEEGKIDFLEVDVNFSSSVLGAIQEYSNIVWLVNNLVPSTKMDSLIEDFTFNVNPLIKILEGINLNIKAKKFIFLSSGGTIYGDSPNFIALTEDNTKNPISAYGLSKTISENYISYLTHKSKNIQSYILRPSNVYGIYQNLKKPQGIVGYAFNSILQKTPLELFNNGVVIRDFLYVDDLSRALEKCLVTEIKWKRVNIYNVGSQKGYSIKEVISIIEKLSNRKIDIVHKPAREFDCHFNVLDISKIKNELKWEPKVGLEEGLLNVWEWIKTQ